MPQPGALKLSELRIRARRLLNVPDDATGQWGDTRLTQEANLATNVLRQKLAHFHRMWKTVRTGPMTVTIGTIPFPTDMMIEQRLLVRVSPIPEKWEEVEVISAQNVDGAGSGGRQKWTVRDNAFVFVGPNFVQGVYDIEYIPYGNTLAADDDYPDIPPQWHDAIAIRMAVVCASEVGEQERSATIREDWKRVEEEIAAEAARFSAMRIHETAPKNFKYGTVGYAKESIKSALVSAGKRTADYWTESRLLLAMNNGLHEMQIDLMALNPEIFSERVPITVTANVAQIPPNTVRLRLFYRTVNGKIRPQRVVALSKQMENFTFSVSDVNVPYEDAFDTATWYVERGNDGMVLRADVNYVVDGNYNAIVELALPRLEHDDQTIGIPLEHLNAFMAKSIAQAAMSAGEMADLAATQSAVYSKSIEGARGRVLTEKVQQKVHRIRDTQGYDDGEEWW